MRCLERKARQHNEMLRKKGKKTQHNRKTKQHNMPETVIFQGKIASSGQPMTVHFLGDALTNCATEAAQLAELESHIQYKAHVITRLMIVWPRRLQKSCMLITTRIRFMAF